jgi:hypothetical protein
MGKRAVAPITSPLIAEALTHFEAQIRADLGRFGATSSSGQARESTPVRRAIVEVLRAAARSLLPVEERDGLSTFRLFQDDFCACAGAETGTGAETGAETGTGTGTGTGTDFEELGRLLEVLLNYEPSRKQRGRFYTPRVVVDDVCGRALAPWCGEGASLPKVIDPACGGGAFLFGTARSLEEACRAHSASGEVDRRAILEHLHGSDIEPLAVAVTELSLALWAGLRRSEPALSERFQVKDSLAASVVGSFDVVIGNPPWVAYAGRATQPLTSARRGFLADQYEAFHGYPTLHACFVELGCRLAKAGRIALLLPSPVADLDGYRPMRRVLSRTHRPLDELVEYGQDAFEDVVQPCFALMADADPAAESTDAPFPLVERSGRLGAAARVQAPEVLQRLRELFTPFPAETFRELGFQTTTVVTKNLLLRDLEPTPPFDLPLLEGRDVTEFSVRAPRLFLQADRDLLRRAHCKLRSREDYESVKFVVRQTAKYTIAALHTGHAFRNSLIAGFDCPAFGAEIIVGLLNSTLLRAIHLASQRDARQKTFPQVKLAHLRSLPSPPTSTARAAKFAQLVRGFTGTKLEPAQRERLDAFVFDWYGVSAEDAVAVERFFVDRNRGQESQDSSKTGELERDASHVTGAGV